MIDKMDTSPLVSAIVPTYNRANYIAETIDSILAQSYGNIEILVIDDGSMDNTLEILEKYNHQITLISRENRGENRTVNEGFNRAAGKYVCVVNSDDPILGECFATLVSALEANPDALIVYGDWAHIGPNNEFINYQFLRRYDCENVLYDILDKIFNFALGPGTLIRKSAIEKYGGRREAYKYCGDMEFYLRLLPYGAFIHIPQLLATHRIHKDSLSSTGGKYAIFKEIRDAVGRFLDSPTVISHTAGIPANRWIFFKALYAWAEKYYAENWRERFVCRCRKNAFGAIVVGHRVARRTVLFCRWLLKIPYALLKWLLPLKILGAAGFKLRRIIFHLAAKRLKKQFADLPPVPSGAKVGEKKRPLFAFSSHFLPPSWSGQAVVISRLVKDMDPEQYLLVGEPFLAPGCEKTDFVGSVGGPYLHLPPIKPFIPFWPFLQVPGSYRWIPFVRNLCVWLIFFSLLHGTLQRAAQIVTRLAPPEQRPKVLIGCSGDLYDLPATLIAAKILGVKVGAWYFDDYGEQWWAEPLLARAVRMQEHFVIFSMDFHIAPNSFMQKKLEYIYNIKHGIPCHVIHNPMGANRLPKANPDFPATSGVLKMVFTGAVYNLNEGAFCAIIKAMQQLQDKFEDMRLELHIYTAQNHTHLRQRGLHGNNVFLHDHVAPKTANAIQANADILLIPFTIEQGSKEFLRTSATAKLADYLPTGRPILTIVPAGSWLQHLFIKYDIGEAVTSPAAADIATAIHKIITQKALRQKRSRNARKLARSQYNRKEEGGKIETILRGIVAE